MATIFSSLSSSSSSSPPLPSRSTPFLHVIYEIETKRSKINIIIWNKTCDVEVGHGSPAGGKQSQKSAQGPDTHLFSQLEVP